MWGHGRGLETELVAIHLGCSRKRHRSKKLDGYQIIMLIYNVARYRRPRELLAITMEEVDSVLHLSDAHHPHDLLDSL